MFKLEEKGGEASFSIYATRLLNQPIFHLRISRRVQRRILLGRDCNPLEEALNPFNALVRKRKRVATYHVGENHSMFLLTWSVVAQSKRFSFAVDWSQEVRGLCLGKFKNHAASRPSKQPCSWRGDPFKAVSIQPEMSAFKKVWFFNRKEKCPRSFACIKCCQ